MTRTRLLILCLLLGLAAWACSPYSPFLRAPRGIGARGPCPLPPRVAAGQPPLQTQVPASLRSFVLPTTTLRPLAGFSVEARVLSRRDYRFGRESDLSPTDLALGWRRMADDAVLARLNIRQSARSFNYSWTRPPPLPRGEMIRSASNMHVIPASSAVAQALARVRSGDRVRIDGWLVEATAPNGWRWRSSTVRDDIGDNACEVVYACAITEL